MARKRAIVIGTGFGGAVAACRLAQAGLEVTVFERGRRYDQLEPEFPRGSLKQWIWTRGTRGLFDVRPISGMQVVQSAGYGGGSLIYANVHLRAPDDVFRDWPEGYDRESLDPYYDLVAYMLDIKPITESPRGVPPKAQVTQDIWTELGRGQQFIHPPLALQYSADDELRPNKFGVLQRGCQYNGQCIIGCRQRAKNTLDFNYLAIAERLGAVVRTECEVVLIEPLQQRAGGYRVHYRDLVEDELPLSTEDAEYVFVCAGALGTTELLLRCKATDALPNISDQLGNAYSGNGDLLAFAFNAERELRPSHGPTITTAMLYDNLRTGDEHVWLLLEEGGFPEELWRLVALANPGIFSLTRSEAEMMEWPPGVRTLTMSDELAARALAATGETRIAPPPLPTDVSAAYDYVAERTVAGPEALRSGPSKPAMLRIFAEAAQMDNTAVFLAMGRDLANGRIELENDVLSLKWDVLSNLFLYNRAERLARDVAGRLNALYGAEPFWKYGRLPVSVHNLGGCKMGSSVNDGVVNDVGEVFNYRNLFVMDGAILPGATGVNPAHTIAAVAERNIEHIIRDITEDGAWVAPERPHATTYDDPLTNVTMPSLGSLRPETPGSAVLYRQRGTGSWTPEGVIAQERPVRCSLELGITDMAEFLRDPNHVITVGGTIAIDGFTNGDTEVVHGVCNLLVAQPGDTRMVSFMLPFHAADGQLYRLHAVRVFVPGPLRGRWREPVMLPFDITLRLAERREPGLDRLAPDADRLDRDAGPEMRVVGQGVLGLALDDLVRTALSLRVKSEEGSVERFWTRIDFARFVYRALTRPGGPGSPA